MTPSISALVIKKILYTKGHQGVVCVFPVSGGALGFESWKGLSASEASLLPSWSDGERGGPWVPAAECLPEEQLGEQP